MTVRIANTVRNSRVDVINAAINADAAAGRLKIYSGVKPAKGGVPAGVLLADITLADPAGSSAGGVLTFTVPVEDLSANATGTASFFYLEDGAGVFVLDGDCGTSGSDLNLTTLSLVAGQPVEITSFTITDGNN